MRAFLNLNGPMKIFACSNCRNTVFFENVQCLHCQGALGYHPELGMVALPRTGLYPCLNYTQHHVCNWVTHQPDQLCRACSLNLCARPQSGRKTGPGFTAFYVGNLAFQPNFPQSGPTRGNAQKIDLARPGRPCSLCR